MQNETPVFDLMAHDLHVSRLDGGDEPGIRYKISKGKMVVTLTVEEISRVVSACRGDWHYVLVQEYWQKAGRVPPQSPIDFDKPKPKPDHF